MRDSGKQEAWNNMIKALLSGAVTIPCPASYTWLISELDRPYIRTGKLSPPVNLHDDRIDVVGDEEVLYTPYLESGTVYRIEKPMIRFARLQEGSLERWAKYKEQLELEVARALGVPPHYFDLAVRSYRWQRLPSESVTKWGERLFSRGLLDTPSIRWEYQKALLALPIEAAQWVIYKFKSSFR